MVGGGAGRRTMSLGRIVLFFTPWRLVAIGISAILFVVALCDTVLPHVGRHELEW